MMGLLATSDFRRIWRIAGPKLPVGKVRGMYISLLSKAYLFLVKWPATSNRTLCAACSVTSVSGIEPGGLS
jgi:hypothetical protein